MNSDLISTSDIDNFERDGVIYLPQAFDLSWVEKIRVGIEKNLLTPSEYGEFLKDNETGGIYFNDYCNWTKFSEFEDYVRNSPAAEISGRLMRSCKSVFYHEHVLVKDAGAGKRTPWHIDQSYYPLDGRQCLSIWMPVDTVEIENTICFVAGSHLWPEWFVPRKFATSLNYKVLDTGDDIRGHSSREYVSVPSDEEVGRHEIRKWKLNPGDCVVFHMKLLHGSPGNTSKLPRRILSTRWLGDDVVIASRPWEVSPPTFGGLEIGDPAVSTEFPVIWMKSSGIK